MDRLHFNKGNLNLLENLVMPALIIINGRALFSNSAMERQAGLNIPALIDLADRGDSGLSPFRIRICQKEVSASIIKAEERDHAVIGIRYNENPGIMILTGQENCSRPLPELLRSIEQSKGIDKVLLVDDNSTIVETYQSMLQLLGYRTFQFTCPSAALKSMEHEHFDLLISDYEMPGMNGLEFLRNLCRERECFPVLMISGYANSIGSIFRSEFRDHMISFMNKPATLDDLSRSIEVIDFFFRLCRFSGD